MKQIKFYSSTKLKKFILIIKCPSSPRAAKSERNDRGGPGFTARKTKIMGRKEEKKKRCEGRGQWVSG